MDINQSYLQRLVDLSKPLTTRQEVAVPSPLMSMNLEENVEVSPTLEIIQTPVSSPLNNKKSEVKDQDSAPVFIFNKTQEVTSVPEIAKDPIVQDEIENKKENSFLPRTFEKENAPVETIQRQEPSHVNFLKKESLEKELLTEEKPSKEFPAMETLWNEVFNTKDTPSPVLSAEKGQIEKIPIREVFTQSHTTTERLEEHFEKHYHEKETVMVFTPEQKQTIHQYIQVAVQAFEKKSAETTPKTEISTTPVKGPSWRGWGGDTGAYTRSKLRIR